MQIQSSLASTALPYAGQVSSSSPQVSAQATVAAPAPESDVPTRQAPSTAVAQQTDDGVRGTLEEVFRAGLDGARATGREQRGRGVERGRRNGVVHREINAMRRAMRQELRSLVRELEGSGDGEEGGSLRADVQQLGRDFDRALRDAAHAERPSASSDPTALSGSARAAFDALSSALTSLLGGSEELAAAGEVEPLAVPEPVAEPAAEPVIEPSAEPAIGPAAEVTEAAADPDSVASTDALLAGLADRFESLLAGLESSLSVFEDEGDEETQHAAVDLAIDANTTLQVDSPDQPAGSQVDALS